MLYRHEQEELRLYRELQRIEFPALGKLSFSYFRNGKNMKTPPAEFTEQIKSSFRRNLEIGAICVVVAADVRRRFQITTIRLARRLIRGQFETICDRGFLRGWPYHEESE